MSQKLNLDKLDYQIIQVMMENAEISYADLGKKLFVSGGTIHVRIKKLQEFGIVIGSRLTINTKALGFDIITFVGIYLEKSSMYEDVAKELKKIPEIVRLNYTTGTYSMFAEIVCKDIQQLKHVLHDELQNIKGIDRTETLISLEESFSRNVLVLDEEEIEQ
ncbi:MAG TPA: Lrp/AsnC ligand binding domain-containing protein [Arachidicoccus sp.]|nr:Lrp/AsnC ligand binding domain-containing protein [Arachidicoccus sp.]